jgi:hypothetical protein
MPKPLPRELTSYDFLKTFAIVTMIIDHIGYYFFPEVLVFRAIGRLSMPVWLFLIGFADSREIDARLLGGAAILVIANIVVGMHILPLNILGTIIIVRLIRDAYASFTFHSGETMLYSWLLLALLLIPAYAVMDYGTLAIGFAMIGYMIRRQEDMPMSSAARNAFMWAVAIGYFVFQVLIFNLNPFLAVVFGLGLYLLMVTLRAFKRVKYTKRTAQWPAWRVQFFKLCGRQTLEIYVIHLLLFKILALVLGDPRFGVLQVALFGDFVV